MQECKNQIASRDGSIQKFVKMNGAGQPIPKDEVYCKAVMAQYDKAQVVQDEKVGLSEKAALLVSLSPPIIFLHLCLSDTKQSLTVKSNASTSKSATSKTKAPSNLTRNFHLS